MQESLDLALVRLHTVDGRIVGAGFLAGERQILTCAHVVARALGLADDMIEQPSSTVKLDFPCLALHTLLTAKVIFWCPVQGDGRGDIAGLELLDEPPFGAKAVQFVPAEDVWEHPFRALGFPDGQDDGVWATGRLLGRQGTNWVVIEDVKTQGFAVGPGFSGTPVWDTQLKGVVGMVVAASQPSTTKTAFVIPFDVLTTTWPQLPSLMRPSVPRNPYKGLSAFTEADARDFFGRETLIDQLATAVETTLTRERRGIQSARLLAVIGASGSGKSSVVRAGLLPCLRTGGVLDSEEWIYLDPIFPGGHPLEALAASLAPHLPARSIVSIRDDLASTPARGLHLLVSQLMASSQRKVVLIVDQFEEVFTHKIDEAQRQHFFDLLVTAVTEPRGPLFVILTLRADFYDRPMRYPELYRLIDEHHISVLPLEREDLRRVIEQPASLPDVQLTFEKGLVEELLFAMHGQSEALPLLEFTLDQLVQRRNENQLTLQAYRQMGGVKGALSQHAEKTYDELSSDQHRQMARDVFLRLIEPRTTEQETMRRRAVRSEFERTDPMQTQQIHETLEAFTRARLLTTNQVSDKTTVEVSHEVLIREWGRLTEWLREFREDILFQHSLSEDVVEWEQRNKPKDRLYRGVQFKEAQTWTKRNKPSKQEEAFLRASGRQGKLRLVSLILVALLLVPSIGIAAWYILTLPPSPILVTTRQDNVNGSLRYCVTYAPSGSTIRFAQDVRGTITLTAGDLVVASNKQLTIVGPGADQLTISGGGNTNAKIRVSKDAVVSISSLGFKNTVTVTDAFLSNEGTLTLTKSIISDNKTTSNSVSGGGGIYNSSTGTLTVIDSTISNNSAIGDLGFGGGIYNEGKLTVTSSTFLGNSASSIISGLGGAIYNLSTATLTVTSSTFSGNSASGKQNGQGGAIGNEGKLTVTNTTFLDNSASGDQIAGGGIYNYDTGILMVTNSTLLNNSASSSGSISTGGGIANRGKLIVTGSTFSGNSASGGKQYNVGGSIVFSSDSKDSFTIIRFCAIYGNNAFLGGGIAVNPAGSGHVTISDSIVAANSAQDGPDISGTVISGGYNLVGNFAGAKGLNATTDKQVKLADLKIDTTLRDNGGPTQTLALLPGSPAIDAVPSQACSITVTDVSGQTVTIATDQRGMKRPDGSENMCDIGAYEHIDQ